MASSNSAIPSSTIVAGSTSQVETLITFDEIEQECRDFKPRYPMFTFRKPQSARIQSEIDRIVDVHLARPKGQRAKLNSDEVQQLKLDLILAAGFAASLIINGPLKNRTRGRGRPPDNTTFILIDDTIQACQRAGLKPGLRFVSGSESLPVQLYIALAPILGFGRMKNPRKLFERWKRLAPDLHRERSALATVCSELGASISPTRRRISSKQTRRHPAGQQRRGSKCLLLYIPSRKHVPARKSGEQPSMKQSVPEPCVRSSAVGAR